MTYPKPSDDNMSHRKRFDKSLNWLNPKLLLNQPCLMQLISSSSFSYSSSTSASYQHWSTPWRRPRKRGLIFLVFTTIRWRQYIIWVFIAKRGRVAHYGFTMFKKRWDTWKSQTEWHLLQLHLSQYLVLQGFLLSVPGGHPNHFSRSNIISRGKVRGGYVKHHIWQGIRPFFLNM